MKGKQASKTAVVEKEEKQEEKTKDRNNVKKIREAMLMCKAELARKAGVSPLTIDRIESGYPCRVDTKRKIILALGMGLSDKQKVWPDRDESDE